MVIATTITPPVTPTPATSPIVLEVVVLGIGAIGVDVMVEMILVDTGSETKMKVILEDHKDIIAFKNHQVVSD